jgi:hypothetical protein
MRVTHLLSLSALVLVLLGSCTGTTGYEIVSFYAGVQGSSDATGGKLDFTTDRGFHVVLTKAKMHIGAVYLDQTRPTAGSAEQSCTLPGTYVGEVRGGATFDLLSGDYQGFPVAGDGSTIPAAIGEVWLTGGDVYATSDPTIVLSVAGTVDINFKTCDTDGPHTIGFAGDITIDKNRSPAAVGSALPGANPICKPRIVTGIEAPITLSQSGTLVLHLDPKALFLNVDFATIKQFSCDPVSYGFTNDDSNQASINLYANLRAAGAVYRFEWRP